VSDCQILDTWYSTGLRGTGSHDFEVKDIFVPEAWQVSMDALSPHPGAIFQGSYFNLLGGVAAVALGIARAAIDEFCSLAQNKKQQASIVPLAQQPAIQERIADAEALVRSGRAFLLETVCEVSAALAEGREVPARLQHLKNLSAVNAARSAAEATQLMYDAAGTTSIYATSRLDRCFRDVHTMKQHFGVGLQRKLAAGEFLLGEYAPGEDVS
jgi:alkylation response protein AidB-like acyl-CoA dehydrogenase